MSGTTEPSPEGTRRRAALVAGAVAVVALVVVAVLVGQDGGEDADPGAGARPTSSPSPSASPSPSPSTPDPTAAATQAPPDAAPGAAAPATDPATVPGSGPVPGVTLPPLTDEPPQVVALDAPAEVGRSTTARVVGVERVTATGTGIGEISGPALLATVEVSNTGTADVDLGSFTVTAYLGTEAVPASPVTTDERATPLTGVLPPGRSARGVYLFSTSGIEGQVLSLTVLSGEDTDLVVFQGELRPGG